MSRLWWSRKAFLNSVKTAGRAKGIASAAAWPSYPASRRHSGLLSLGQLAPIRDPPLSLDVYA
jgi:hypothetical protein